MNQFNHQTGKYFEINGAKIYYEMIGHKKNPVLIMLHGGFENIENLNPLATYLSKFFYIIGVDTRGHGKSTLGTDRLTYSLMQEDVEHLLNDLGINTCSILGFSDGGTVAYRIASSHHLQVTNLITIGSSWRNEDISDSEDALKNITPESAKEIFSDNYSHYLKLNPSPDFDYFTQVVVTMWCDHSPDNYPNALVENISSNTLLVRGDNDFLITLESLSLLQTQLPEASLANIPFAEHVVYEDQPEILQLILKYFLKL